MKKTVKFLLVAVLAVCIALSLIACEKETASDSGATKITIELVSVGDDGALLSEKDLPEGETQYYTISGYTFSDSDSKIVTNAANDKYYYTDYYTAITTSDSSSVSKEEYAAQKARYEELSSLTLPKAVKVKAPDSKINLTAENLKAANGGVVDLSEGSANAKTIYIRSVKDSAFIGHTEIKNLTVPDTYLALASASFSGCANLEEVTLPFVGGKADAVNGAKNFGYIFGTYEYEGGTSVTQSYNLSGSATYYVPSSLKKVTINADVGAYAFYGVTTVEEINYEKSAVVPDFAFHGCTGLKSVTLPVSTTGIGNGAFGHCSSLNTINLSELLSLTYIGNEAFEHCEKLCYSETEKTLRLPASVAFIGENAFEGCSSVEKIVFKAETSATVRASAFAEMSALKKADLKNLALSVGAFSSWSDFLEVTLDGCTVAIGVADGDDAGIAPADALDVKYAFVGAIEVTTWIEANIEFTIL